MKTISETTGAWNNQRLASELGYPFSGSRPGGASWNQIGRSQLLGAMSLKNSARALDSISLIKPAAPYSPLGITNNLVTNVLTGGTGKFWSNLNPGIRPNTGPRAGDSIDIEA